uniref:Putative tail protein n=1 Tax=viral metagenome TaxID=1070528 RepID=A0A6M3JX47_9ZZZZ
MAAIVHTDVSISAAGNIRWTGAATTNKHSVLEFIQYLMDKQDDGTAANDDLLDITVDTPFNRSTDQIVTLNSPFNIDDTFATHLYDGSVSQTEPTLGGETLYAGLRVIGPVVAGTEYMILQDGRVLPAFWGTGINPEPTPSLVFSRHLVKVKYAGSDIDGKRVMVLARELGDQYRRFPVTFGTGNSVAAIGNGADIFNITADAVIAAWTILNTEGFQELDISGAGAAGQEFYSRWETGAQTINNVYEYTKWISQRSHIADQTGGTPTGKNFVIDNATITGQAQSFKPLTGDEMLTEVRAQIKIGGGTPTGTIYAELFDSDDVASQLAEPTGTALARSENILASAITNSYEEVIFRFNRLNPATGADQTAALELNSITYPEMFIVFRHDDGSAANYFHLDGEETSEDATMNQASYQTAAWTADATDDINIIVKSSPQIHAIPGEQFQGINIEVGYDLETGVVPIQNEVVMWGTKVTYSTLVGNFIAGELVTFKNGTTIVSGGTIYDDDGVDEFIVGLDSPGAAVIVATDTIKGLISGATAIVTSVIDVEKSGGTGILIAIDDNGTTGELYLQVLSGANPVDNNLIRDPISGDPVANYYTATAVLNSKTVSPEFLGTSTGSNIIGAYGIGFDPLDVGASDRFTDLNDDAITPPNNVVFTVSGIIAGDRVLVGPRTGTALNRGQWLLATALDDGIIGVPETACVVKTGTDTVPFPDAQENWPKTGIGANVSRLRIERDSGIYARIPYDSHNGTDTFTLGTPDTGVIAMSVAGNNTFTRATGSFLTDGFEPGCVFTSTGFTNAGNNSLFVALTVTATTIVPTDATGMVTEVEGVNEQIASNGWEFANGDGSTNFNLASINNDVFLAFIDVATIGTSETFTGVHVTANDRDMFVRVRDGGATPIKTFENITAQFKSTPQTIAATRTADN